MDKGSDAAYNRKQRTIEKNAVSLHMPVGHLQDILLHEKKKKKSRRKKMS